MLEFFRRTSRVAAVFAVYLVVSHGLNRELFEQMEFAIPDDKTVLTVGDSQTRVALDPEIISGSVNVSQFAEPYTLTLPKLARILDRNGHITAVLLGFGYHHFSAFQDDALVEPVKAREMIRRYYPITGWSRLRQIPNDPRQLFLGTLREGVFPNRSAVKRFIPSRLGGEPEPTYIGSFFAQSGGHLDDDRLDFTIRHHFGRTDAPYGASSSATDAFGAIVELTRARGIQLVLVHTPVHERYSSRVPPDIESAYLEALERALEEPHVTYIDGELLDLPDSLFYDFYHVNREGATRLSQWVDRELESTKWNVLRSAANPLITIESEGIDAEYGFRNVNGPSVIRVPDWLENPLGRYYLYFAHHRGSYIRMAYADDLEGPWNVVKGGVLDLAATPALDHIASPDVHVDADDQTIRMYFHSVDDTTTWRQTTYMATSSDGLEFVSDSEPMGPPYLRAFRWRDEMWAVAKVRGGPGGVLLRADSDHGPFAEGPLFLEGMRHGAVLVQDEGVEIFFSRIGDEPERLLVTTIDPARMWTNPYVPVIRELMRPELPYEGADLPIEQSAVGETTSRVNALRDPHVFMDEDGDIYLLYTIAGESGIAIATISR